MKWGLVEAQHQQTKEKIMACIAIGQFKGELGYIVEDDEGTWIVFAYGGYTRDFLLYEHPKQ